MNKLLIKSSIFCILIVLLLSFVSDPIFESLGSDSKKFKEFNRNHSDSLDILFLGSSHALYTFNPSILDSIFHTKSYNLATLGQRFLSTNLLLEDVLKKKKTKLVIVDFFPEYMDLPQKAVHKGLQLGILDNIDLNKQKLQAINSFYNLEEFPSVFSETIRNHDQWYNLYLKNELETKSTFNKGWIGPDKTFKKDSLKYIDYLLKSETYLSIEPTAKENIRLNYIKDYVDETIKICTKHNVKLCFVSAPYLPSFYDNKVNKKHYYMNEYFKSEDVSFLDFNTKFIALNLTLKDFQDRHHLNADGSKKATIFLSQFIENQGYFNVKNQVYYNKLVEELNLKNIDEVYQDIYNIKFNLISKIIKKGIINPVNKGVKEDTQVDNLFLFKEDEFKYVLLEAKPQMISTFFKNKNVLIRGEVFKKDFNKRPKRLLGTDKNKIFWNVSGDTLSNKDKSYVLFTLKKRGELDEYKSFSIFAKDKNGKTTKARLEVLDATFIKK